MSSSKMSIIISKSILLSTTLLVSGIIVEHNSALASDFSLDNEKQVRPNKLQEALDQSVGVTKEGGKFISESNEKYTLEEKKKWILDALSSLKTLTDYTRVFKYYLSEYDCLVPTDDLAVKEDLGVKGWDEDKKLFNGENLEFYLFTPTFNKGMMAYGEINEEEAVNIITLLNLRLSRKSIMLESRMGENNIKMKNAFDKALSEAFDGRNLRTDRGNLLSAIFDGNGEKIDEKNKLVSLLQVCKGSFEQEISDRKYKIKLNYSSSQCTKKNKEIQLKVNENWATYLMGIQLLKNMKIEDKQKIIDNMKAKTLASNMTDVETKDLLNFYVILKYKIFSFMNTNDFAYPKCAKQASLLSNKLANEDLENDREIILRGEEIHKIPSKFTLQNKQSWIIEACALLKKYESYLDNIMYGPFDLNHSTYPSWDDSQHLFHDSLKIGTSFKNDSTSVYTQLTEIDEWFIDQTILPEMLVRLLKDHHENILWKQVKKPQNLTTEEKPIPRMIIEIYNIFEQNIRFLQTNGQLLSDYIRKNRFMEIHSNPKYAHSNDVSEVTLEKSHSENRLKVQKKLDKLSAYAEEFVERMNLFKILTLDRLSSTDKERETEVYRQFFLEFVTQISVNHTKEDIQQAYKIVTYQQDLFYQFYALINSDLSKNSPLPLPLDQLTSKALNGGFTEVKKKVEPPKQEKKEETKVMFVSVSNAQREKTRDRLRDQHAINSMTRLLVESEKIVEKSTGYEQKKSANMNDSQPILSDAERKAIEAELTAKPQISSKKHARKHLAPPKITLTKKKNKEAPKISAKKVPQIKSPENTEGIEMVLYNGKYVPVAQWSPMPKTEPKKHVVKEVKAENRVQVVPQNTWVPQSQSVVKEVKVVNAASMLPKNRLVPQSQSPIKPAKAMEPKPTFHNSPSVFQKQGTASIGNQKTASTLKKQPQIVISPAPSSVNAVPTLSSIFVQNVEPMVETLSIVPQVVEQRDVVDNEVKNLVKTEEQNKVTNHNIVSLNRILRADDKDPLVCVIDKRDIQTDRLKVLIHPNPSSVDTNFFRGPLKAIFHIHHQGFEAEICDRAIIRSDSKLTSQQSSITYFNISLETNPYLYQYDQAKFYVNETQSQLKPLVWDINAIEKLTNVEKIVVEILPDTKISPMQESVLEAKPEFKIMHWYQGHKK